MKKVFSIMLTLVLALSLLSFNSMNVNAAKTLDLNDQICDGAKIVIPKGEYKLNTLYLDDVKNVTIDFSGSTITGGNFFRVYSGAKKIKIKRGKFNGKKSLYGANIYGGSITFDKCTFSGCDNAIRIWGGTATLNDCNCKNSYHMGLAIYGVKTKVNINGGYYQKNGTRSDASEGGASDAHAAGIGVYEGSTLIIKNATVKKNHGSGIVLDGRKMKPTAKVYGCTITNNGDHGVGVNPNGALFMDKLKVDGKTKYNVVEKNACDGVMLMNGSSAKKIAYLKSNKNKRDGLAVSFNSKATEISNCQINNNKRFGLILYDNSKVKKLKKTVKYKGNKWGNLQIDYGCVVNY